MRSMRWGVVVAACLAGAGPSAAVSPDAASRVESKRADLSGAPGMEVITSVSEYRTGQGIARHTHHGIETGYVLAGTMVQYPGQPPTMLPTGATFMNLRDVPHAGFRVVGKRPLRVFAVHIVDKGRPLYEWVR